MVPRMSAPVRQTTRLLLVLASENAKLPFRWPRCRPPAGTFSLCAIRIVTGPVSPRLSPALALSEDFGEVIRQIFRRAMDRARFLRALNNGHGSIDGDGFGLCRRSRSRETQTRPKG